jgi:hypothetical protein
MPCENVSQWTGQRNEGESTTNGEPLAVGSVCNLYDSREEKKYAGYGIGTQSRNLQGKPSTDTVSARTTLTEGPKVDRTASNISKAFWSCDVKPNCEEWRLERGCFEAKDGAWPTWENARMASVPDVSKSWMVSYKSL